MLSKPSATLLHPAGGTELSMSPWGLWQTLGGSELPYTTAQASGEGWWRREGSHPIPVGLCSFCSTQTSLQSPWLILLQHLQREWGCEVREERTVLSCPPWGSGTRRFTYL